jgi:hypothetical protein
LLVGKNLNINKFYRSFLHLQLVQYIQDYTLINNKTYNSKKERDFQENEEYLHEPLISNFLKILEELIRIEMEILFFHRKLDAQYWIGTHISDLV